MVNQQKDAETCGGWGGEVLVFLVTPKVCSLDRKGKHDDDSGNRTETKDGLLIKRGKTKNTPSVKKKLHTGLEAMTSPTPEWAEGTAIARLEVGTFPSLSSLLQLLEKWMRGGAGPQPAQSNCI